MSPPLRHAPRKAASRAHAFHWLAGFVLLGALVVVARGLGEERHFAEVARGAKPSWLVVAASLQIATYVCLARAWSTAITRAGGVAPRLSSLLKLALAELFTDQALPSMGLGGTFLVVTVLERRGVSARAAAVAVVASLVGFNVAQLVLVLAAIASLVARRHVVHFSVVVGAVALLAAACLLALTAVIAAGGLHRLPRRLQRLHFVATLRDAIAAAPRVIALAPRTILPVAALRLMILLLDGATLAATLAAVGHPLGIDATVGAYVLAAVIGSVSLLPGGLGSFEAVATGLLVVSDVPIEAAVSATLLMRGLSFWLPMLPGLWFARRVTRTAR